MDATQQQLQSIYAAGPRPTASVGTSTQSFFLSTPPATPLPTATPTSSIPAAILSMGSSQRSPRGSLKGYIQFAMGTKALIAGQQAKALDLFLAAGMEGVAMGSSVAAFCSEFRLGMDQDNNDPMDVGGELPTPRGQVTQENYETAERLYTLAALQGCGMAMARLAFLKTHGRVGIKIHHAEAEKWRKGCAARGEDAVRWLRATATAGIAASQFCLALCYYNGIAVTEDDNEAFVWCEKAAEQNLAGAMNVLGNLYIEGAGCHKDPSKGLKWYIRAAERREPAAIYNIGTLFERGIAVEEDLAQAFGWYERASRFGSINAMNTLGIFYEQGLGMDHPMPFLAVRSYLEAARLGHPHAQYNLGRCYHEGFGLIRDDEKAASWFTQAATQNHAISQLSLAICCEYGLGMKKSRPLARRNFALSFANGAAEAEKRLLPLTALALLPTARAILHPSRRPSTALIHTLPRELLDHILTLTQHPTHLPPAHVRAVLAIAATPTSLFSPHLRSKDAYLELVGLAHLQISALPLPSCDCTRFGDDDDDETDESADSPMSCRAIKHVVDAIDKAEAYPPTHWDWTLEIAPAAEPSASHSAYSPTLHCQPYYTPEPVWWKDPLMSLESPKTP
ncbi:hypothetical protein PhCBS80983_g04525 [Powellomyces hirtus]|uniref:F-box domain-containing protein n=1 Tax=Powellomyces hirtus TaxID=109895 RepID=A0A507DXF2_9FUNG|nr:hypothetical protein PhCBS80983_g04525 [Powellomyces hirtus]